MKSNIYQIKLKSGQHIGWTSTQAAIIYKIFSLKMKYKPKCQVDFYPSSQYFHKTSQLYGRTSTQAAKTQTHMAKCAPQAQTVALKTLKITQAYNSEPNNLIKLISNCFKLIFDRSNCYAEPTPWASPSFIFNKHGGFATYGGWPSATRSVLRTSLYVLRRELRLRLALSSLGGFATVVLRRPLRGAFSFFNYGRCAPSVNWLRRWFASLHHLLSLSEAEVSASSCWLVVLF